MIRRVLRWLARREIEAEVQWERAQCVAAIRMHKELAYAQGKLDGTNAAFQVVEEAMRERMAGGEDAWQAQDLAAARKRLVH